MDDINGFLKDLVNVILGFEDFVLVCSVLEYENLVRVVDDVSIVLKFRICVIDELGVVGEIESFSMDELDVVGKFENFFMVFNELVVVERIESFIIDGLEIVEKFDNFLRVFDELRVVEKIESIVIDGLEVVEKFENFRVFDELEVVGDLGIFFFNNVVDIFLNVIYCYEDYSYVSFEIFIEEELSDLDMGLISMNDNFNLDDIDEVVDVLEINLE